MGRELSGGPGTQRWAGNSAVGRELSGGPGTQRWARNSAVGQELSGGPGTQRWARNSAVGQELSGGPGTQRRTRNSAASIVQKRMSPPRARGASLFRATRRPCSSPICARSRAILVADARGRESAWLSRLASLAAARRTHKHLFAYVPSAGVRTLRTHVLFITQARSAAASREDAAVGPLVPVARGRLRRRLGGRPGRVGRRAISVLVGGIRRAVRWPRGCASASDGSTESSRCAASGDRCVCGADLSMSCRWASSRRSVVRLLLAGEVLRGCCAQVGVVKEPLVT